MKSPFMREILLILIVGSLALLLPTVESNDASAENHIDCRYKGGVGGIYGDSEYDGEYLYITSSLGLRIFDVSNSSDPERIGFVATQGSPLSITVAGDYAYLALGHGKSGLLVVDITDKTNPQEIGFYNVSAEYCVDVAVAGDYAYVTATDLDSNGKDFLEIVDIADRANPKRVGHYDTSAPPSGVAVLGDYAYVCADAFVVIDISDPTNPVKKAHASFSSSVWDVVVSGYYAYTVDWVAWNLSVVDISDPENPMKVGDYDIEGVGGRVAVSGDYAYLADGENGLVILDISNPKNPTKEGHYEAAEFAHANGVAVAGDFAYVTYGHMEYERRGSVRANEILVAEDKALVATEKSTENEPNKVNGLVIVNVADKNKPQKAGYYEIADSAQGVAVWGDYAYIADDDMDLFIVDASDKTNPQKVSGYRIMGSIQDVAALGNCVYIVNGSSMIIVNVTDKSNPQRLGDYETVGNAVGVAVKGNYAYVAEGGNGLVVVDITNKSDPQKVGHCDTDGDARGVVVEGDYAYIADGGNGLVIVDISDRTDPQKVGGYDTTFWTQDVAIAGNYAYVVDERDGLVVVAISDPKNPTKVGHNNNVGGYRAEGVAVKGDYAFVVSGEAGLFVVDISNPSKPTNVGHPPIHYGRLHRISIVENYAYIADYYHGLRILELAPVAHIDSIAPSPAFGIDTINLEGHGTDDGLISQYAWRSSLDGELYVGEEARFDTDTLSLGEHTIYFKVEDNYGVWSEEVSGILVIHEKPLAYIDSISPNPSPVNEPLYFLGHGIDDGTIQGYAWRSSLDGEIYNEQDSCFITAPWLESGEGGSLGTNWAHEGDADWYITSLEHHTGTRCLSSGDVSDSETSSIEREITGPGVIEFYWMVSSEVNYDYFRFFVDEIEQENITGETTWEYASYNLSEGVHILKWVYEKDEGGSYNDDCGYLDDIRWTDDKKWHDAINLSVGKHTIFFKVRDNYGVWSEEASTVLTIHEKPIAIIDEVSSVSLENEPVFFTGHGTDDGSIKNYHWRSSIDGSLSIEASFTSSSLSVGTHLIYLRVQDNYGVWSEETNIISTIHKKPVARISSVLPQISFDLQEVSFEGYGIDDGTVERYVWRSNIDGEIHNSTASGFSTDELSVGEHNISLKVQDNYGIWSEEISISLLKLEVLISSISPNPAEKGQSVRFEGELNGIDVDELLDELLAVDPESIILFAWRSSIDGQLSIGTDSSFSSSSLSSGTHTILLTIEIRSELLEERYSDEVSVVLEVKNPTTKEDEQWYQSSFVVGSCSLVVLLVAVFFAYLVSTGQKKEPETTLPKPGMYESLTTPEPPTTQAPSITQPTESHDAISNDEQPSLQSSKHRPATERGEKEMKKQEKESSDAIVISGELRDERSEEKKKREDEVATISKACPHCKEPMKSHWLLCPYCKNKPQEENDQKSREEGPEHTCTECKKSVKTHWQICPYCKARLNRKEG